MARPRHGRRSSPRSRDLGATDVLVVATEGTGAGPQPEATVAVVDVPGDDSDAMVRLHAAIDVLAAPPPAIVDAVEAFDADRTAVVFGTFLTETPDLVGRPLVAHRRPEWVALEDKTIVDALLDRAGVTRAASTVVPVGDAAQAWRALDHGSGTVWAADARDGYHGGGARTRWVTDDDEASAAAADLAPWCDAVRVMPFLEGIATSVHGIVLPDDVVALRPVELVTLRRGHDLRYAGCATFWDPPSAIRDEMRDAARRVGALLRDEIDYRGAFTLDGVATADGFRPTELNPRFGAGLGVITRGLDGLPLHLVLDLVVSGTHLEISATELEALLLERVRRQPQRWILAAAREDTARGDRSRRSLRGRNVALGRARRAERRRRRRQGRLRPHLVRGVPDARRPERWRAVSGVLALRRPRARHGRRTAHRTVRRHALKVQMLRPAADQYSSRNRRL